MSRKCKHITVSVSQEQYYRTRLLAAEYDTTVTSLVASLLEHMPTLLRRTNYPKPKLEIPTPLAISPQPPTPGAGESPKAGLRSLTTEN